MSDVHDLHSSQSLLEDIGVIRSGDGLPPERDEAVIFEVLEEQLSCNKSPSQ